MALRRAVGGLDSDLRSVPVAIVDSCERYKTGLTVDLERTGVSVDHSVGDWLGWTVRPGPRALLVTDRCRQYLGVIEKVNSYSSEASTVVLLEQPSVPSLVSVLRRGVDGIARIDDSAGEIAHSIQMAVQGKVVVDAGHLQALASHSETLPSMDHFSDDEEALLRLLGEGASTAAIARAGHISERTVYRRLKRVYRLLGVASREEAQRTARVLIE